ncbi:MAG: hypothetical protein U0797_13600 [Gemmataceae bacterium]
MQWDAPGDIPLPSTDMDGEVHVRGLEVQGKLFDSSNDVPNRVAAFQGGSTITVSVAATSRRSSVPRRVRTARRCTWPTTSRAERSGS